MGEKTVVTNRRARREYFVEEGVDPGVLGLVALVLGVVHRAGVLGQGGLELAQLALESVGLDLVRLLGLLDEDDHAARLFDFEEAGADRDAGRLGAFLEADDAGHDRRDERFVVRKNAELSLDARDLDARHVHEPWTAPGGVPAGYPEPVVDHAHERKVALDRFERVRRA